MIDKSSIIRITINALLLFFGSGACNSPSSENQKQAPRQVIVEQLHSMTSLFEEFSKVDSLVVLFFSDKKKFRYYTVAVSTDQEILATFQDNARFFKTASPQCLKDGTIYCYNKGSIFATVYFNMTDSCSYLSMFKGADLYYFPLIEEFKVQLLNLKKSAVAPD
ncbi:MAG: hypothetical protein J0I84_09910, partial [Terrimonas sp.]|nr:hypothetical protein [Terrimonas sp.]